MFYPPKKQSHPPSLRYPRERFYIWACVFVSKYFLTRWFITHAFHTLFETHTHVCGIWTFMSVIMSFSCVFFNWTGQRMMSPVTNEYRRQPGFSGQHLGRGWACPSPAPQCNLCYGPLQHLPPAAEAAEGWSSGKVPRDAAGVEEWQVPQPIRPPAVDVGHPSPVGTIHHAIRWFFSPHLTFFLPSAPFKGFFGHPHPSGNNLIWKNWLHSGCTALS